MTKREKALYAITSPVLIPAVFVGFVFICYFRAAQLLWLLALGKLEEGKNA